MTKFKAIMKLLWFILLVISSIIGSCLLQKCMLQQVYDIGDELFDD